MTYWAAFAAKHDSKQNVLCNFLFKVLMISIYDINAKYLCYYSTKYNVTFLHVNIIQCLAVLTVLNLNKI